MVLQEVAFEADMQVICPGRVTILLLAAIAALPCSQAAQAQAEIGLCPLEALCHLLEVRGVLAASDGTRSELAEGTEEAATWSALHVRSASWPPPGRLLAASWPPPGLLRKGHVCTERCRHEGASRVHDGAYRTLKNRTESLRPESTRRSTRREGLNVQLRKQGPR